MRRSSTFATFKDKNMFKIYKQFRLKGWQTYRLICMSKQQQNTYKYLSV